MKIDFEHEFKNVHKNDIRQFMEVLKRLRPDLGTLRVTDPDSFESEEELDPRFLLSLDGLFETGMVRATIRYAVYKKQKKRSDAERFLEENSAVLKWLVNAEFSPLISVSWPQRFASATKQRKLDSSWIKDWFTELKEFRGKRALASLARAVVEQGLTERFEDALIAVDFALELKDLKPIENVKNPYGDRIFDNTHLFPVRRKLLQSPDEIENNHLRSIEMLRIFVDEREGQSQLQWPVINQLKDAIMALLSHKKVDAKKHTGARRADP